MEDFDFATLVVRMFVTFTHVSAHKDNNERMPTGKNIQIGYSYGTVEEMKAKAKEWLDANPDANLSLQPRQVPSWQKPAPVRKAKTATLPQWLLNYIWRK